MPVLHSNIIGTGDQHFIILHGFLGMGDNWKTHAKKISQKGYESLTKEEKQKLFNASKK